MKNIKFPIFILIILLYGCDSFVDVDLPDSQLTGPAVYEDRATAAAALSNIYAKLRDTGFLSGGLMGSSMQFGMYGDELAYYGMGGTANEAVYNNNLLPSTSAVGQLWNESYHQVYCANAVIEGVRNSAVLSAADKDIFTGEALFIRALVHFYLVNVYGDVPYITTTDYSQNQRAARIPQADVLALIVADLEEARELLPQAYISPERVRPNKSVATALLSRTYLYMGQWGAASNAASAVINNAEYVWEPDLNKVFRKNSTATIWQFKPRLTGVNADEGSTFIFTSGPPLNVALTPELADSFEPGDQRRESWIRSITNGTDTWLHAYKYKENTNTGTSVEYTILFRLAEQYLIRAEARARQGELISALEDLDLIRSRAGLSGSTAVTAEEILAAVLQERRHELFTEHGHRFFDLKRTGQLDAVLSAVKPGWAITDLLWPLPESELLLNEHLLPQNPGY